MLCLTLSLPRHRLKISLTKRKFLRGEKDFFQKITNLRKGSKFSRFFRHLFEQKRIKAILGGNLALLTFAAATFSPSVSAMSLMGQTEITTLSPGVVELTTKVAVRVPLQTISITQGYAFFHPGIDFDGVTGDPVYPIMDGQIEAVIYDRFGLGNHIIVNHGSGLKSIYAHLSKVEVKTGDKVETDKVIGRVGKSGRAFGDHLHLEVFDNGRSINPRTILPLN